MDDWQRVIDNLEWLMDHTEIKNPSALGAAAKVSPSSVWNILKRKNCPTIDMLEKLARPFRVHTWQLLAPTAMLEKALSSDVTKVLEAYHRSDQTGRETIIRVAETQAQYQESAKDR